MIRYVRAWWQILKAASGTVMRGGRQVDLYFRYFVLRNLDEAGLFNYLEEPRTYGQILAHTGFSDNKFTRELLDVLAADRNNVIIAEDGHYRINPEVPLPTIDTIVGKTDKRFHSFTMLAEGMAANVVPKLRSERIEFSQGFEAEGRNFLAKFDAVLANRVYGGSRQAILEFLRKEERDWLRGKHLLDIGCGSGRETAELWLKLKGKTRITAVDPVEGMLKLARANFEIHLKELNPAHPAITTENRPVFKQANAASLPFEDNTFDAAFIMYVLHWTPDPRKVIREMVRVVKPGGLIIGAQGFRPEANEYFDVTLRTNENCFGFFWREDFRRWFAEHDLTVDMVTPAGVFRVKNSPQTPIRIEVGHDKS